MPGPPLVHIYCDGACSPNPGWGGWAALLMSVDNPGHTREISGAEPATTNNRMELTAALMALRALKKPCEVVVHTDSTYVRNAFEKGWLAKWQKNGWRTSAKQSVLNEDLWRELFAVAQQHSVTWVWVRGHSDNVHHNRCDELAVLARKHLAAG